MDDWWVACCVHLPTFWGLGRRGFYGWLLGRSNGGSVDVSRNNRQLGHRYELRLLHIDPTLRFNIERSLPFYTNMPGDCLLSYHMSVSCYMSSTMIPVT
jgi:hypothetical protein